MNRHAPPPERRPLVGWVVRHQVGLLLTAAVMLGIGGAAGIVFGLDLGAAPSPAHAATPSQPLPPVTGPPSPSETPAVTADAEPPPEAETVVVERTVQGPARAPVTVLVTATVSGPTTTATRTATATVTTTATRTAATTATVTAITTATVTLPAVPVP